MGSLVSKFYGGSLDGKVLGKNIRGFRYIVPVDDRTRETYVRDRTRYEYDENHVPTVIAYKLESTEKCIKAAEHDYGECQYEVITS